MAEKVCNPIRSVETMAEKVTVMVLKVDLQCSCCYKKVKKLLCTFPEIRDLEFHEKENIVMITVVCCSPKKILEKICCKGGKTIKSIQIKDEKPKPDDQKPKPDDQKPKPKPDDQKPKPDDQKPKPKSDDQKPKPDDHPPVQAQVVIVQYGYPGMPCCGPCSKGYTGGPCYHGYGRPAPPRPVCHGYGYEDGYVYGYGGSRPCNVSHCGNYFCEENSSGCTIM